MQNQTVALNTVVEVGLEVLSPLHIGGAGEKIWIQNIDFFYTGEEVVILDQAKLIKALKEATYDDGTSALKAYQNKLASGREWEISKFLEACDIDFHQVSKKVYPLEVEPANEIRPLIRTGMNETIIPGSSIKGAIRSIIIHTLYNQVSPYVDRIEQDLLGDIGNNLMKFIRPYDAVCKNTAITNCELFNLFQNYGNWESDYKQGFLISTESFARGASTHFQLAIANGLLDVLNKEGQRISKHLTPRYANRIVKSTDPVAFLFQMINDYTKTHLERELAFFKRYNQAEDTDYIIDNLESYLKLAQGDKSCILRLAYGSGFHGMTGDWRFPDHTTTVRNPDTKNRTWNPNTRQVEPARYKSRKITGLDIDATLMGFVKLSI